jgi:hypothetical protein
MQSLDDDCLQLILLHLTTKELIHQFSLVNTRFRQLLYRKGSFDNDTTYLTFNAVSNVNSIQIEFLNRWISTCNITAFDCNCDLVLLSIVFNQCIEPLKVEHVQLVIPETSIQDNNIEHLRFRNLKSLILTLSSNMQVFHLLLSGCSSLLLEKLVIRQPHDYPVKDSHSENYLNRCFKTKDSQYTVLKHLEFHGTPIFTVNSILELIAKSPMLKTIILSNFEQAAFPIIESLIKEERFANLKPSILTILSTRRLSSASQNPQLIMNNTELLGSVKQFSLMSEFFDISIDELKLLLLGLTNVERLEINYKGFYMTDRFMNNLNFQYLSTLKITGVLFSDTDAPVAILKAAPVLRTVSIISSTFRQFTRLNCYEVYSCNTVTEVEIDPYFTFLLRFTPNVVKIRIIPPLTRPRSSLSSMNDLLLLKRVNVLSIYFGSHSFNHLLPIIIATGSSVTQFHLSLSRSLNIKKKKSSLFPPDFGNTLQTKLFQYIRTQFIDEAEEAIQLLTETCFTTDLFHKIMKNEKICEQLSGYNLIFSIAREDFIHYFTNN